MDFLKVLITELNKTKGQIYNLFLPVLSKISMKMKSQTSFHSDYLSTFSKFSVLISLKPVAIAFVSISPFLPESRLPLNGKQFETMHILSPFFSVYIDKAITDENFRNVMKRNLKQVNQSSDIIRAKQAEIGSALKGIFMNMIKSSPVSKV